MLTHRHATSQRRRILLFPFGNSNGQPNDMVSVYLDYADTKREEGWHVCAQFALVISNPNDPRIYSTSREYTQAWRKVSSKLTICARRCDHRGPSSLHSRRDGLVSDERPTLLRRSACLTILPSPHHLAGASHGSMSCANSPRRATATRDPSSRATQRESQPLFESSRTRLASCGTTSSTTTPRRRRASSVSRTKARRAT